MSKIKAILIATGTAIGGIFLALFGIQRKKIKEQKKEIEAKTTQIRKQQEVVKANNEASKSIPEIVQEGQKKEQKIKQEIKEAKKSEQPIKKSIGVGNSIVNSFNNKQL